MTTDNDELDKLPTFKRNGWKYVYAFIALLGITGLTLSILYRAKPKSGEILQRQRMKNATQVSYAIVFSKVPPAVADSIINGIIADIGPDTLTTDMVLGSTVTDPWCASVGDYRKSLYKALTESPDINVGKQTLITSMIAGLLRKSELPARLYFIGDLHTDNVASLEKRSQQTASDFDMRNGIMGPLKVITYMRPMNTINTTYISYFLKKGYPVEIR